MNEVLPISLVVAAGYLTGRRRLAVSILGVMPILSALLSGLAIWSENQPNAAFAAFTLGLMPIFTLLGYLPVLVLGPLAETPIPGR